jgi:hypothetical protein
MMTVEVEVSDDLDPPRLHRLTEVTGWGRKISRDNWLDQLKGRRLTLNGTATGHGEGSPRWTQPAPNPQVWPVQPLGCG